VAEPINKVATYAPFSWTGFYIGIHAGGDVFSKDWYAPRTATNAAAFCLVCPTSAGSHDGRSWLAGGQLGFNYQIAWFVGGIEAQISATSLQGSNPIPSAPAITVHSKADTLGTVAARVGIAFDRTLFFVKGGAAFAHDKFWSSTTGGPDLSSATDTRWGWMIGVGAEWAFFENWSVKFEYDHMDFRRRRETLAPVGVGAVPFDYDISQTVDLVKIGLNYRFGYSPVVAKY
jgi:outer membrane immunogenic protein